MARLRLEQHGEIDSDLLVKVEFKRSPTAPIGQRADLLTSANGRLMPAVSGEVDGLSSLQQLRALIGDGSGTTRWVRVRQRGTTGDNEDSYANLDRIGDVVFANALDGEVAVLKSADGAELGEVHLISALDIIRTLAHR